MCPHVEGVQQVQRISVMLAAPDRKSSKEKCQAWPGRKGTAVSVGRARVSREYPEAPGVR